MFSQHQPRGQVAREKTNSRDDKTSIADGYEKSSAMRSSGRSLHAGERVGGADGAAARLGMNRTTFPLRNEKIRPSLQNSTMNRSLPLHPLALTLCTFDGFDPFQLF